MKKRYLNNYFTKLTSLESRDFKREALLWWIRLTLAALSKAEKAACKFLATGFLRVVLINFFKTTSRFRFRAVLILSFLTFFNADFMMGMVGMVTQTIALMQEILLQF